MHRYTLQTSFCQARFFIQKRRNFCPFKKSKYSEEAWSLFDIQMYIVFGNEDTN